MVASSRPRQQKRKDWILRSQSSGMERIEAFFHGRGYAMHRHDTYAIGITLGGVQSFQYKKSMRHSLPGNTMALYPDEPHDGQAGSEAGFRYRMLYIEPSLLQDALGGVALPFIEGGISTDPRLFGAVGNLLLHMDDEVEPLQQDDGIFELARAMDAVSGKRPRRHAADFGAAQLAREYIHGALDRTLTLDELAQASGRDRWSLTRDFRSFFGTSPYRYLSMRRLDMARRLMAQGLPLADAAAMSGFADQSHMTRLFTKTYGIAPAHWLRIMRRGA
ncbi:AraC family transcriptional regulator [Herbaspirillum sp. 3R11]|nr:AraC family transcriptional regulator [Herbaspirillum sp. 3R-3a1]TFI10449.1 AraC family transcriptional regulator [Herbaspirillum sp. 3R11]TFI16354.1 AraC family transcriptional regulator [Herbaspirillum sp. 3R-11]TFI24921.1 AraC family transcriptional regulator [Herbaspirillum sp. 3C11]